MTAPLPRNRVLQETEPQRPPESDEMRRDMPKASSLSVDEMEQRVIARTAGKFETIGRYVSGDEDETIVPVLGSYHTRHVGARRDEAVAKNSFWLKAKNDELDRLDAEAKLADAESHPV